MASTGMALSGKFHVKWNSTGTDGVSGEVDIERTGECQLPDTIDNEESELVTNMATRKDIANKSGYQNPTVTCFFRPENYVRLLADKKNGSLGTLTYECSAADGGACTAVYNAKVISVAGASGDVEGFMESFDATFGIIAMDSFAGSLGTQAYD